MPGGVSTTAAKRISRLPIQTFMNGPLVPFCAQALDTSSAAKPIVCNAIFAYKRKPAFLAATAVVPQM